MNNGDRDQFGLTERDNHAIHTIFLKYPEVEKVIIFGSRAKSTYKLGSDLDLAIMNEGVSTKTLIRLAHEFDDSSLPFKVDLVDFYTIKNHDLMEHIRRVGKVFFERERIYHQ